MRRMLGDWAAGFAIVVGSAMVVMAGATAVLVASSGSGQLMAPRPLGAAGGALLVVLVAAWVVWRAARRLLSLERSSTARVDAPAVADVRLAELGPARVIVLPPSRLQPESRVLDVRVPSTAEAVLQALGPQSPPRQPA